MALGMVVGKKVKTHSQYLGCIFENNRFQKLIPIVIEKVKEIRKLHPFDAIAFTGTSGAALAFILSYKLRIPLICVRRNKNDGHHAKCPAWMSSYPSLLEGMMDAKSYLIVDDFIEHGTTVNRIIGSINKLPKHGTCAAILLYSVPLSGKRFDFFEKSNVQIPVFEIKDET